MALHDRNPIATESVSQTTATNSVELGTRRYYEGNDYIYVYNAGGEQVSKGEMGFMAASSMGTGYSVTVTNLVGHVGAELIVGVACNATLPTAEYGWLCTRGLVQFALDGNEVSMNSGKFLAPGIDGGFVSGMVTLSTSLRVGVVIDSGVTTVLSNRARFKSPLFG